MKFIFFICSDRKAPTYNAAEDNIDEWIEEVGERRLMGDMLVKPANGKTIALRGGIIKEHPGSFEETSNAILGFDVIECEDIAEATQIAVAHPMAKFGQIEIRPFAVFD